MTEPKKNPQIEVGGVLLCSMCAAQMVPIDGKMTCNVCGYKE